MLWKINNAMMQVPQPGNHMKKKNSNWYKKAHW